MPSIMHILNHCSTLMAFSNFLTFSLRKKCYWCTQLYLIFHPQYFLISNVKSNTHGYILRNQYNFHVPRSTCSLTAEMPIIDFPRLWNDLDEDLRCLDNELAFKKILKSSLLDKYGSFNCTKLFCMSCGNI